jgi:hypothetical protein
MVDGQTTNGETRNRTEDTTIFSDTEAGLTGRKCPVNRRVARLVCRTAMPVVSRGCRRLKDVALAPRPFQIKGSAAAARRSAGNAAVRSAGNAAVGLFTAFYLYASFLAWH